MGSSSSPEKQKKHKSKDTTLSTPSSSSALPTTISGFTVLPIAYSPTATHVIYARAHSAPKKKTKNAKGKQKEELPEGRTLFLVNVPPDATERELVVLFKPCGTVERVIFSLDKGSAQEGHLAGEEDEDESGDEGNESGGGEVPPSSESDGEHDEGARPRKRRKVSQPEGPKIEPLPSAPLRTLRKTGQTAYVVFLDSSALARALQPPPQPYAWPVDPMAPLGLAHYAAEYAAARPPLDAVRAHADSWMAAFEHAQAQRRQQSAYRKGEAVVDEDGFTLVTRGGAYGKTLGGGVGVASKRFMGEQGAAGGRRHRKKKDGKEQDVFYSFQVREKKRQEIVDLKKKFEEDKAKIAKLQSSRKFNPY